MVTLEQDSSKVPPSLEPSVEVYYFGDATVSPYGANGLDPEYYREGIQLP